MNRDKPIDVLSVGELLIDLMSTDYVENVELAINFKRLAGGSPANFGGNLKRLGMNAHLISSVGNDAFGNYLVKYVEDIGLKTDGITRMPAPTTIIVVTKSKEVSDFEAYRGADAEILPHHFPDALLEKTNIFHTTCFALSKNPAQMSILDAAKRAQQFGAQLSIDVNYAQKLWNDTAQARDIVGWFANHGAFIKCSEVDWQRLYGSELINPPLALDYFTQLGANEVCITLGDKGCWATDGNQSFFLESRPVLVNDTTGAGDAFWSGYVCGRLNNKTLKESMQMGRRMAELKIESKEGLPNAINFESLLEI